MVLLVLVLLVPQLNNDHVNEHAFMDTPFHGHVYATFSLSSR